MADLIQRLKDININRESDELNVGFLNQRLRVVNTEIFGMMITEQSFENVYHQGNHASYGNATGVNQNGIHACYLSVLSMEYTSEYLIMETENVIHDRNMKTETVIHDEHMEVDSASDDERMETDSSPTNKAYNEFRVAQPAVSDDDDDDITSVSSNGIVEMMEVDSVSGDEGTETYSVASDEDLNGIHAWRSIFDDVDHISMSSIDSEDRMEIDSVSGDEEDTEAGSIALHEIFENITIGRNPDEGNRRPLATRPRVDDNASRHGGDHASAACSTDEDQNGIRVAPSAVGDDGVAITSSTGSVSGCVASGEVIDGIASKKKRKSDENDYGPPAKKPRLDDDQNEIRVASGEVIDGIASKKKRKSVVENDYGPPAKKPRLDDDRNGIRVAPDEVIDGIASKKKRKSVVENDYGPPAKKPRPDDVTSYSVIGFSNCRLAVGDSRGAVRPPVTT